MPITELRAPRYAPIMQPVIPELARLVPLLRSTSESEEVEAERMSLATKLDRRVAMYGVDVFKLASGRADSQFDVVKVPFARDLIYANGGKVTLFTYVLQHGSEEVGNTMSMELLMHGLTMPVTGVLLHGSTRQRTALADLIEGKLRFPGTLEAARRRST